MINEMPRQGSAYYFVLLDPPETEIRGVANFSNVLRGSFHACFSAIRSEKCGKGRG